MIDFLGGLHPVIQALLATCFTWALTALGAAGVFLTRELNRKVLNGMLGFASGIMIAASFWSLLAPAIELSGGKTLPIWFPAATGFILGGVFLWSVDKILPHLHPGLAPTETEGIKTSWQRSTLLVMAITLHNIPEGLAVGVAFGAVASGLPSVTLPAAIALAVSMPLRREGMSRLKSFWYGQLSGIVEPIAGVIGAGAVMLIQPIMPYALGFAAGAMIFVVVEELVPESHHGKYAHLATAGVLIGFVVMMILDVALG